MAGVTGRAVTEAEEDVANANNPQHAAKVLAEGGDGRAEDDDDLRNKNANRSSAIEVYFLSCVSCFNAVEFFRQCT